MNHLLCCLSHGLYVRRPGEYALGQAPWIGSRARRPQAWSPKMGESTQVHDDVVATPAHWNLSAGSTRGINPLNGGRLSCVQFLPDNIT